jgi:hypothetical protein
MEWEHTQSWYAQQNFDCWYIDGGTTAMSEYEYVNHAAVELACSNGLRDAGHGGWTLQQLMANNVDLIERSGLQRAEVMALRLYTGIRHRSFAVLLCAFSHYFQFFFALTGMAGPMYLW